MSRPGVRAEVERMEREEFALLDVLLKARHEAGLSQAQVAKLMGTRALLIRGRGRPFRSREPRPLSSQRNAASLANLETPRLRKRVTHRGARPCLGGAAGPAVDNPADWQIIRPRLQNGLGCRERNGLR